MSRETAPEEGETSLELLPPIRDSLEAHNRFMCKPRESLIFREKVLQRSKALEGEKNEREGYFAPVTVREFFEAHKKVVHKPRETLSWLERKCLEEEGGPVNEEHRLCEDCFFHDRTERGLQRVCV